MSEKWRQNKAWEDANLTGAWRPLKWVLRAFASITLAVSLLLLVVLYGVAASVPVGLIALAPTWAVYACSLLVIVALVAGIPVWTAGRVLKGSTPLVRFVVRFGLAMVLMPAGVWLWRALAWPRLVYDPATGSGLRFFADFVRDYGAVTLRRLPGVEMSELEFYSWWPLRLILLLFVVNLVVATVRRIDFNFKNIGVLTVHTGIIVIALGSVYYAGLKREGDTLLIAGEIGPNGRPGVGPPQDRFYDNTDVALYVDQGKGFEQRPLAGVPRYNDYALDAFSGTSAWTTAGMREPWDVTPRRELSLEVPPSRFGLVDSDLKFRIVGYSAYAEPVNDWLKVEPGDTRGVSLAGTNTPLRLVFLHSDLVDPETGQAPQGPIYAFTLPPRVPKDRIADNGVFAVEYTLGSAAGMPELRWRDLIEKLPEGTRTALVVEVPAKSYRGVFPVDLGTEITAGDTGWSMQVKQLLPTPPFPIITEGYRGATSSVAVVEVKPPGGPAFDRYVYHRFPEINQDVLGTQPDGRPNRRDADPAIRISLIEAKQLQVYIDEPRPGVTRAAVRQPGGTIRVLESDEIGAEGWLREIVPKVSLRIGDRWDAATRVERPAPVPPQEQEKQFLGGHDKAMLAVEVNSIRPDGAPFTRIVWLPFTKYMGVMGDPERTVILPDGRHVTLVFGRVQHPLPGFTISLVDFQMIAYDHRGAPRDYQSIIRVTPVGDARFDEFEHVTKLNEPLRAPFMWSQSRSLPANIGGTLAAGLNPRQFKLSQSGWDASGWQRTQAQADAGTIPSPYASFTILGVGNNPGIHIIALGGVLMGVGIPWAFYVKPWLVRREKRRIQESLAAGTYQKPPRPRSADTESGARPEHAGV